LARFAAGPDTAILAALYEAQTEVAAPASAHHCPLRAGPARLWHGDHLGTRFAVAVSLLAVSARLEDHLQDGDSLPVPRFIARRLTRRWAVKAQESAAALGFDIRPLQQQIATQRHRERQPNQPPDYYAEPTAFCFGEAFAHTARLSQRPENIAPLRQVGRAFGQQVYLLDAVEDLAVDQRRRRFNPLTACGTPGTAYQIAEQWLKQAQQTMEVHLAAVTMPRPEWVRPVLGDSLRQIARQRLRCVTSCSRADSCASAKKTSSDKEPQEKIRRLYLSCCMVGTICGLINGGILGHACADIERQCCCC
jgi:hypothetical protein